MEMLSDRSSTLLISTIARKEPIGLFFVQIWRRESNSKERDREGSRFGEPASRSRSKATERGGAAGRRVAEQAV